MKQIWSRTKSWRSVPQAHEQPIVSLDSFQVALAWKQMSNPSNVPLPIHSDNLLLKKMGLINLPIDSGEQVKNTFFNFDNTISIIKRTSLYVQRLCCPHVVFISDVLQASQRQYEYQMEKASWTLNSMSSRNFFLQGNTEAGAMILWKFYLSFYEIRKNFHMECSLWFSVRIIYSAER